MGGCSRGCVEVHLLILYRNWAYVSPTTHSPTPAWTQSSEEGGRWPVFLLRLFTVMFDQYLHYLPAVNRQPITWCKDCVCFPFHTDKPIPTQALTHFEYKAVYAHCWYINFALKAFIIRLAAGRRQTDGLPANKSIGLWEVHHPLHDDLQTGCRQRGA